MDAIVQSTDKNFLVPVSTPVPAMDPLLARARLPVKDTCSGPLHSSLPNLAHSHSRCPKHIALVVAHMGRLTPAVHSWRGLRIA